MPRRSYTGFFVIHDDIDLIVATVFQGGVSLCSQKASGLGREATGTNLTLFLFSQPLFKSEGSGLC